MNRTACSKSKHGPGDLSEGGRQSGEARHSGRTRVSRRTVMLAAGSAAVASLAGCLGNGDDNPGLSAADVEPAGEPIDTSGVSWDDLGDLEGEFTIYSGRTRDQIDPLFEMIEDEYPDLDVTINQADNDDQVSQLQLEGEDSPADVFYSQDPGALSVVAGDGLSQELPDDFAEAIDERFRDPDNEWVGASGRTRSVLYNAELLADEGIDPDTLPTDIMEYAYDDRFEGIISTRPNSGTFRGFVSAMIELEGEEATRDWLNAMAEDQDATLYSSGSTQAEAVASGDQTIALGNQYYAGRILNQDPDAPLGVHFTEDDAGVLFSVAGLTVLESADDVELAVEFLRHMFSREVQEHLIEVNGEYPVIDGVEYVGDLPAREELNPPEFDLSQFDMELSEVRDIIAAEGMSV